MIKKKPICLICILITISLGTVHGYNERFGDVAQIIHDLNCPPNVSVVSKPIRDIIELLSVSSTGLHPATDYHMEVRAPCRDMSPPTLKEMENWLKNWAGTQKKDKATHGVNFDDENPKMIKLFQKLRTLKSHAYGTIHYTMRTKCQKVICAAKASFGEREGVQLLYMLARYGFNGSPIAFKLNEKHWEFWQSHEIDKILVALSDFPEGLLPITKNRQLTRFKRGYTYQKYANFEKTGRARCVLAHERIEVFDCIDMHSRSEYQQAIFHEVAHIIGMEYGLDDSSTWWNISGWEKTTVPNKSIGFNNKYKANRPECLVSEYAGNNPREDFAESLVAYRYNPQPMKDNCPGKYNYLKDLAFDNIEYIDKSGCEDKSISERLFPGIRRWLRSINYRS